MSTWILIIIISSNINAISHIPFSSKDKCMTALTEIKKQKSWDYAIRAVCVEE